MRIGVIGLMHESNTFAEGLTTLADFERGILATGAEMRERYVDSHHEVGGFFEQLANENVEDVPIFAAWTMPSGTISRDAARELADSAVRCLRQAGPLAGLLVAPHGAAVAEGELDFDGFWLSQVRDVLGPNVPIVGTLDLHANLSPRMAAATTALLAYRTNPHLDQRQTGRDAAALLLRMLRNEVLPTSATVFPSLAVNIEAQATAEFPCRELYALADEVRQRPNVLAVNLLLGFPYADVPEMGASLSVVTDHDLPLARQYAEEIAQYWWGRRADFQGQLTSVEDAVRQAKFAPGPVCLLDMGDNVGGGSPADETWIAHELRRQQVVPAFVCLFDPDAVQAASRAGVGGQVQLDVGSRSSKEGRPLPGPFTVQKLTDGNFSESEARHGGLRNYSQGPTAIVESHGLTVMLTSQRMAPFSLSQLTTFDVDPAHFRVLVAKGVHAPVAAYRPVCPTLIRVNSPGITSADLTRFTFHNLVYSPLSAVRHAVRLFMQFQRLRR